MEGIKEKYDGGEASAREAFDELCGMYEALEVCWVLVISIVISSVISSSIIE